MRLNGDVLRQLSSIKYLGVHIDQHLTWSTHIDSVLNKVRGKLYCINRLRPISCKVLRLLYQANRLKPIFCKVLRLLYQAYILPILDYCDTVWSP